MTTETMIDSAREAIGAAGPDDWKIRLTRHPEELQVKAPALAAVLRKSAFSALAREFEEKDAQADKNQKKFKNTADRANLAVLLTTGFSALVLIAALLIPDSSGFKKYALAAIGAGGVISGGLGAMWVYQTREGKLLDAWMSARASAEVLRRRYFEQIANLETAFGDSPIPLLLLQFEYFRRYQLDVQSRFYEKRALEHERDADKWMRLSSYSVAGAAVAAGLSGLDPALIWIAALGAVATAYGSFASTKDAVNQSRRNADLYSKAKDAIAKLEEKLDEVRAEAAAGEREPIMQFVTALHDQLAAEHRQWLQAAESIQPALDKLEQTLSNLRTKRQGKQPPQSNQGEAVRAK